MLSHPCAHFVYLVPMLGHLGSILIHLGSLFEPWGGICTNKSIEPQGDTKEFKKRFEGLPGESIS